MFKVMTWNVENLFRVGQPSGPTTAAVYDNKLHAVITTGRRWDPVIAAPWRRAPRGDAVRRLTSSRRPVELGRGEPTRH